jgi:hypothetical protein
MRTSLKKIKAEEVEPEQADSQLVVRPSQALIIAPYVADADAEGEFSSSDSIRPTMAIVAKTGDRSDQFPPGSIILNNEFIIGDIKHPVEIASVIKIKKRFQNDLPFAPGSDFGDVVDHAVEFVDKGGVLEYRPFNDKISTHYWIPLLQIMWLVKQPVDLPPDAATLFPFELGGSNYAIVGYTARTKTAYNGVAKILIDAKSKRGTVRELAYKLTTKGESWQDRSWIQANLRATGSVDPEIAKFIDANEV